MGFRSVGRKNYIPSSRRRALSNIYVNRRRARDVTTITARRFANQSRSSSFRIHTRAPYIYNTRIQPFSVSVLRAHKRPLIYDWKKSYTRTRVYIYIYLAIISGGPSKT